MILASTWSEIITLYFALRKTPIYFYKKLEKNNNYSEIDPF